MHFTHLIRRNSIKSAAVSDGERRIARAIARAKQLAAEPLKKSEKFRTVRLVNAAIGAAISGLAAAAASMVAGGHPWKDVVPLAFTVVLLVIAAIFGVQAGVIGTVLAALVFAAFLFSPVGSLNVANDSARSNLGWMLLIGLVFSFLFAPPTSGFRRH